MCLAVPARIVACDRQVAKVEVLGNVRAADISLLESAQVGDYVLVHAGFAIQRFEPDEARKLLAIWREMEA